MIQISSNLNLSDYLNWTFPKFPDLPWNHQAMLDLAMAQYGSFVARAVAVGQPP